MKSYQRLLPEQEASKSIEQGRLKIGRNPQNDWVILDPERVVSKTHCAIEAVGADFVLTDTSSNGVFINTSEEPVGKGNRVTLRNGDQIRISDYHIDVVIAERDQQTVPRPVAPGGSTAGDKSDLLSDGAATADPFNLGRNGPSRPVVPNRPVAPAPAPEAAARPDHVPAHEEFFRPPEPSLQIPQPSPRIPEDWDAEPEDKLPEPPLAPPSVAPALPPDAGQAAVQTAPDPQFPPARQAPPQGAKPHAAPAQGAAQSTAPPPGSVQTDQALAAFLEGAGLGGLEIPEHQSRETLMIIGAVFREVIHGLMEVLASRTQIKSEFRLAQTTIKPTDNNPLKFSLSVDDALLAILTKQGSGYLPPVEAFRESLDDIKAHQVAVLAGMQVALHGLLQRFDPQVLAERIEKEGGGMLTSKKARYWDAFNQLYEQIASEAEDDFHGLFGREFARAYEEQAAKQRMGKE
jgi:type VI secretion system protein